MRVQRNHAVLNLCYEKPQIWKKHYVPNGNHQILQAPCTEQESSDKDNFSILITELAKVLRRHNYELSAVVAPNPQIAAVAYDTAILTATLDWMLVAANDYYGSDSRRTAYLLPTSSDDSYKIENIVSYRQ